MNINLTKEEFRVEGFTLSVTEPCLVEECVVEIYDGVSNAQLFYFDILYWTWAAIIISFGIPMNCLIVHYEWFGGDPQKRSLSNRIISSSVIANISAGISMHTFTAMIRWRIGTAAFQAVFFKMYIGCTYAAFTFANLSTIVRFVQVVIWKRVMEIDEELAAAVINRSVVCVCFLLGSLCHPEFKLYGIISVLSNSSIEMPLASCKDGIDPLHQK